MALPRFRHVLYHLLEGPVKWFTGEKIAKMFDFTTEIESLDLNKKVCLRNPGGAISRAHLEDAQMQDIP
jgi:hypothetical protein